MPASRFRVFDGSELLAVYQRLGDGALLRQKTGLLARCDVAICASSKASARVDHHTKRVLPSCIDFGAFQKHVPDLVYPPLFPKPEGATYVGFTGVLADETTDVNLVHAMLLRFPDYRFIFAGSTNRPGLLAEWKKHRNFHHFSTPDEALRAAVMNQLDVAIVPDAEGGGNQRASDEQKLFEYFACGIPVLSTRLTDAVKFEGMVTCAGSIWEFLHALEKLATKHRPHSPGPGIAIAKQHSWANQARQFGDWLSEQLNGKPASSRTESAAPGM